MAQPIAAPNIAPSGTLLPVVPNPNSEKDASSTRLKPQRISNLHFSNSEPIGRRAKSVPANEHSPLATREPLIGTRERLETHVSNRKQTAGHASNGYSSRVANYRLIFAYPLPYPPLADVLPRFASRRGGVLHPRPKSEKSEKCGKWERTRLRPIVEKMLLRGLLGLLGAVVVAYAIDALQVRVRLARGGPSSVYSAVTVYYAAELKGGKYEVFTGRPDRETCASSLFPQMGYEPCWYLRQHKVKVVE